MTLAITPETNFWLLIGLGALLLVCVGLIIYFVLIRSRKTLTAVSSATPTKQTIDAITKMKLFPHFEEIGIYTDFSGTILFVTESISKSLGWLPENLVGENAMILIPPQYEKSYKVGMKKLNEVSVSHFLDKVLNVSLLNEDRKEVPVEVIIRMHHDDGHKYLIGIVKDMSAYNAKIKSLEWMVKFYRDSLSTIDTGVFVCDVLEGIVTMDDNGLSIFDLPPDERTVPISATTLRVMSSDRERLRDVVSNAIENNINYAIEIELVSGRKIKIVASTQLGKDGKVDFLIGAFRILPKE